ncbi:hypothetical protein [Sutcliffiella sp. NC1]|uniref:hypothetical protein n=1 Tax=Sutcliffiella sp. NC1 TaxID=3004096 RepID=UPI0022DE32F1|nr:hypothetical protein [Sutcliffiella sp. NC1]WBL16459.1 hypothetical protein O1A01_07455 [Sutcliffiella sp. NC1]
MEEVEDLKFLSLYETKKWVKAVIESSNEILDLNHKQQQLLDEYFRLQRFDLKQRMDEIRELEGIQQYYFIIALNKFRDWLEEAVEHYKDLKKIKSLIDHEIPYIRDVRNMREHEIEYFKKKGRKQEKFFHENDSSISDATSVIVTDGNYLVGGRISVQKALKLFDELYPFFEQKLDNYYIKEEK